MKKDSLFLPRVPKRTHPGSAVSNAVNLPVMKLAARMTPVQRDRNARIQQEIFRGRSPKGGRLWTGRPGNCRLNRVAGSIVASRHC
jgi:hypothetical protein